jgi:glutamate-1-semialdehyde 2,1-aminomutase
MRQDSVEMTTEAVRRSMARSRQLQDRLHALIPGGAHTYARGDDQYPEGMAPIIARGRGSHVWDVDGNEYIEYGSGLRAVTLGHGEERVVAAAYRAMQAGLGYVRPSAVEVDGAEALLGLIEAAEMVKFAKNGSDVTTAAVKLARAVTGRDLVAIPDEQPFLSTDDWFIGRTAMPAGIPQAIRDLTVTFHYNDVASLERLFAAHPGRIACVVMEPAWAVEPVPSFLEGVRAACTREGTLLVFDEMITGFRWHLGGAQHVYGIAPDLSTFGKALGNGFAVSALVGRRDLMERGGLHHQHERVFLLSTTHGAETSALAAACEVMRIYREEGVCEQLTERGDRLAAGVRGAAVTAGVADRFLLLGRSCNLVYATLDQDGRRSQSLRTLFLQETLARGILAPSFVVSVALSDADIDRTVECVGEALLVYRRALEEGIEHHLVGRPVKPVFRPFA